MDWSDPVRVCVCVWVCGCVCVLLCSRFVFFWSVVSSQVVPHIAMHCSALPCLCLAWRERVYGELSGWWFMGCLVARSLGGLLCEHRLLACLPACVADGVIERRVGLLVDAGAKPVLPHLLPLPSPCDRAKVPTPHHGGAGDLCWRMHDCARAVLVECSSSARAAFDGHLVRWVTGYSLSSCLACSVLLLCVTAWNRLMAALCWCAQSSPLCSWGWRPRFHRIPSTIFQRITCLSWLPGAWKQPNRPHHCLGARNALKEQGSDLRWRQWQLLCQVFGRDWLGSCTCAGGYHSWRLCGPGRRQQMWHLRSCGCPVPKYTRAYFFAGLDVTRTCCVGLLF